MGRYKTHNLDEGGWTEWIQPVEENYKMRCCDCGLVHTMDFRVEGERAQFRVRRNERATSASRRKKK